MKESKKLSSAEMLSLLEEAQTMYDKEHSLNMQQMQILDQQNGAILSLRRETERLELENNNLREENSELAEEISRLKAEQKREQRQINKEKESLKEAWKRIGQTRKENQNETKRIKELSESVDRTVQTRLAQERQALTEQNGRVLRRETARAWLLNSAILPITACYSLFVTALICIDKMDVIQSASQWFRLQIENIRQFVGTLESYPVLESNQILIVLIVAAASAYPIYQGAKGVWNAFVTWYAEGWTKYTKPNERRLKTAFTALLCMESFMAALIIAEKTGKPWVPYCIFLSAATTALHHEVGRHIKIY